MKLYALAQAHGALVHTDAVQAFGKMPVNFGLLGVDMMTIAAHKIGGPTAIGALVVRDGLPLEPLVHGGGQELRRRAGTENLVGIAGFAAVAKENQLNIKALRDQLEEALERCRDLWWRCPNGFPTRLIFPTPACQPKPC